MDTISIEDFAAKVKSSFISYFTDYIWASATASAPWLLTPIVSYFAKAIIEKFITFVAVEGGMVVFMINTGVFTTDQGRDYMSKVEALHRLPDDIQESEWERVEREANHAFGNLFNWTK